MEFFVYAAALAVAMFIFLRMTWNYKPRNLELVSSSSESEPLLPAKAKVISVHSLTGTRRHSESSPCSECSGASCLGRTERARTALWPHCAYVHLATPSSGCSQHATTLAQE